MIQSYAALVTPLDLEEGLRLVSPGRREKARAYRSEADAKLSVGAELLLNYGLRRLAPQVPTPAAYHLDANGKPRLTGATPEFNLSHAGAYAVCAISDRPVGVDVELEADVPLDIARKFFHPDEYRRIAASRDPARCFFDCWVLKESYMKAVGLGFSLPPDSFCVEPDGDSARVSENGVARPFQFAIRRMGIYHMALCRASNEPLSRDVWAFVDIRDCLNAGRP